MADEKGNDIAIEIEAMLDKAKAPSKTECCIYKVPYEIWQLNQNACTPKVISIGPFHHGDPILQKMEREKQVYLKRLLQGTRTNLGMLASRVEELEQRVHSSYSEDINFPKKDFVKMILLDARFILEFFYLCFAGWDEDDALLQITWWMEGIKRDLCLLENQLPFFVLDELYNLAFANSPRDSPQTFLDLTLHVLASQNKQNLDLEFVTLCHFTDLLRKFHLQYDEPPITRRKNRIDFNTVTKLCEAGIKITANKKTRCLLNLQFSGDTLKIPQLTLDDETEMLFYNMIALEQCHYPLEQSVTDYIRVLSYLIKTDEDADIVVKNGIIVNCLDCSNNAGRLFHSLVKNAPLLSFNSRYYPLREDLKEFCEKPTCNCR